MFCVYQAATFQRAGDGETNLAGAVESSGSVARNETHNHEIEYPNDDDGCFVFVQDETDGVSNDDDDDVSSDEEDDDDDDDDDDDEDDGMFHEDEGGENIDEKAESGTPIDQEDVDESSTRGAESVYNHSAPPAAASTTASGARPSPDAMRARLGRLAVRELRLTRKLRRLAQVERLHDSGRCWNGTGKGKRIGKGKGKGKGSEDWADIGGRGQGCWEGKGGKGKGWVGGGRKGGEDKGWEGGKGKGKGKGKGWADGDGKGKGGKGGKGKGKGGKGKGWEDGGGKGFDWEGKGKGGKDHQWGKGKGGKGKGKGFKGHPHPNEHFHEVPWFSDWNLDNSWGEEGEMSVHWWHDRRRGPEIEARRLLKAHLQAAVRACMKRYRNSRI